MLLKNHASCVVEYRPDIRENMGIFTTDTLEDIKSCDMMIEIGYEKDGQPKWKRQLAQPNVDNKKTIFVNQDESVFHVNDNDTGVWLKDGRGRDREKGKGESTWVVGIEISYVNNMCIGWCHIYLLINF